MLSRLLAGFRRINRPPPPEDSIPLRVATTVATLIGVAALLTSEIVRPSTALFGFLGIPLGMAFSWALRRRDNWEVKLVLTFAIMIAFGAFLRSIARVGIGSIADTIQPLGELMVWVQVLHAFDLPGRRDLYFSLAAAVSMVAAGAVQALTNTFGLVMFAFGLASVVALKLAHQSEIADVKKVLGGTVLFPVGKKGGSEAGAVESGWRPAASVKSAAAVVALFAVFAVSTVATFALLPRFRTGRVVKLPFSIKGVSPTRSDGFRIETPGLTEATGDGGATVVEGGYFGFANRMDLSVRGRPSDDLVMRVRADRPAFWRGLAYATYDGRYWHADDDPPHKIDSLENEVVLPNPAGPSLGANRYEELIQTFYIESPQANLVFGAYRPTRLYYPAAYVRVDRDGSVRSPVEVDKGMVYSVVSRRLKVDPEALMTAEYGTELPRAELGRYLQVPESLPQRVRDLAYRITEGKQTRYEKVLAIESWLMHNTEYTLDIPPLPEGADALDQFLFEDKKGFCEQIATAEVILLRLAGVPARLVSGYVPGNRSFFAGMYEVRGSDAHTWTEIYYPGLGWVESDPTYVVPPAGAFSQVKEAIGWLHDQYESMPAWVQAPFDSVGRYIRGIYRLEPVNLATALLGAVVAAASFMWLRRRKRQKAEASLAWEEKMLGRLEGAARRLNIEREPHETLREFAYRLWLSRANAIRGSGVGDDGRTELGRVTEHLERQVFGRDPLADPDRRAVEEMISRLEALLKESAKTAAAAGRPTGPRA